MVQAISWFPLYDRNPQTYVDNIFFAKAPRLQKGDNKIFDGGQPRSSKGGDASGFPEHQTFKMTAAPIPTGRCRIAQLKFLVLAFFSSALDAPASQALR